MAVETIAKNPTASFGARSDIGGGPSNVDGLGKVFLYSFAFLGALFFFGRLIVGIVGVFQNGIFENAPGMPTGGFDTGFNFI